MNRYSIALASTVVCRRFTQVLHCSIRWRSTSGVLCLAISALLAGAHAQAAGPDADSGVTPDIDRPMSLSDRRHLLLRTGFGVSPRDLLSLEGLSRREGVRTIVDGLRAQPAQAMPAWVDAPLPHFHARVDMPADERLSFRLARDAELAQLRQWWVREMLASDSPQTEKLVLFWHDLFATSYHDIGSRSRAMARQNRLFRSMGSGRWEPLLKAMIRDPALLDYLDNENNHKRAPTENLARELLELFTLGEGNYEEETVRQAARALTGFSRAPLRDDQFLLKVWQQDRGEKVLFGRRARHDGDSLIEAILAQPAAPRFLARRFWLAYVSDEEPPADWLDPISRGFRDAGFDIRWLYEATLMHETFWSSEARAARVKSPVDLLVGLARSLDFPKRQWQTLPARLAELDMDLFAPPNVAGWREGRAFVSPGRLLARRQMVDEMLRARPVQTDPNSMQASTRSMMMSGAARSREELGSAVSDNTRRTRSLVLRITAENYRGDSEYYVELLRGDDEQQRPSSLWTSPVRAVVDGRDTARLGRVESAADLPWQAHRLEVPAALLHRADRVRVHFVNDAAGADGDRNLYVDGLWLEQAWLAANQGVQQSNCVPKEASAAGNLYCGGWLEMRLPRVSMVDPAPSSRAAAPDASTESASLESAESHDSDSASYRASAVHLQWVNANAEKRRHRIEFVLDHFQHPGTQHDVFSFSVEALPDDRFELRLNSFGCFPDCVRLWPDCTWKDQHSSAWQTLAFPLAARDRSALAGEQDTAADAQWCHHDGLEPDDQQMVAVLWRSVPMLLDRVRDSHRAERLREHFNAFEARFAKARPKITESFWAMDANASGADQLTIDPLVAPAPHPPEQLQAPALTVNTLDDWLSAMQAMDLGVLEVLSPGVEIEQNDALQALQDLPADVQLDRLIRLPLFQVF